MTQRELYLRPHEAMQWAQCELRALRGSGPSRGRIPIRHVVRSMALRMLSGMDPEPTPPFCKLDGVTGRVRDAQIQARAIAGVASELLGEDLLGAPVTERYELIEGGILQGDDLLMSLCIEPQIGMEWFVLAGAAAARQEEPVCLRILHIPRARIGTPCVGQSLVRGTRSAIEAWQTWEEHIGEIITGARRAVARPGSHCRTCSLSECALRAESKNRAN